MTIGEMQKQKYAIILEALCLGVPVRYAAEWDLVFNLGTNTLYEVYYQRPQGEDVFRKSKMTLNEFINHYAEIENEDLKRIFGNIRLWKLQNRLIEENK
jgi:hypothetical protein